MYRLIGITLLALVQGWFKGESPTYILNEDTHPGGMRLGVSHTTCHDEFQRKLRSHSYCLIFSVPWQEQLQPYNKNARQHTPGEKKEKIQVRFSSQTRKKPRFSSKKEGRARTHRKWWFVCFFDANEKHPLRTGSITFGGQIIVCDHCCSGTGV